jgi:hypothetical protein
VILGGGQYTVKVSVDVPPVTSEAHQGRFDQLEQQMQVCQDK